MSSTGQVRVLAALFLLSSCGEGGEGDGSSAPGGVNDPGAGGAPVIADRDDLCANAIATETEPLDEREIVLSTTVRLDDYCTLYDCPESVLDWCEPGNVSRGTRCYAGCGVVSYVVDFEESGFTLHTFSAWTGDLVGIHTSSDTALYCGGFALISGDPEPPPWSRDACASAEEVPCCRVQFY